MGETIDKVRLPCPECGKIYALHKAQVKAHQGETKRCKTPECAGKIIIQFEKENEEEPASARVERVAPIQEPEPQGGSIRVETVDDGSGRKVAEVYLVDRDYGYVLDTEGNRARFSLSNYALGNLVEGERVRYRDVRVEKGLDAVDVERVDPEEHKTVKRLKGTVSWFEKGRGVIDTEDGAEIDVHWSEIRSLKKFKILEEGDEVEYEEGEHRGRKVAVRVKRTDPRPPLERFAYLGPIDDRTGELAKLAQNEKWDYQSAPNPCPRPVLKSYLYYTFARLEKQKKVIVEEEYACFNTGLVTDYQEEIWALFVPTRGKSAWRLEGFYKESDRKVLGLFKKPPELADYFDDPAQLLYNWKLPLVIDKEHIMHRKERFPEKFRESEHLVLSALTAAQDLVTKRVRRNYKTAIPQFYQNALQLLLPLCIEGPVVADCALAVSKQGEAYRGETVLTLDWAYRNARLIARPDDEWLAP